MKISVMKESLLENINIVIKAVTTRSTLPILECILLIAENNSVKLMANDLDMAIETVYFQAEVEEPGSIALEAKIFSDIVRKLPDDYVTIDVDGRNIALIKSRKSEFKILGFNGNDFPMLPQIDKDQSFRLNASDLKNMIKQTIFSVAVDESKPILTGELLEIKNGFFNIVAVDGFRVSYRRREISKDISLRLPELSVTAPAKSLNELSKIIPNDESLENPQLVNIFFTDRHIMFEMDNFTLVSRLLEGDFYKYGLIFNDDHSTVVTVDRHQFIIGLERVALMSNKELKKNPIKLEMNDDLMVISSNTELGTAKDEIPVEIDGSNITIAFNPKYLIDVLRAIDEESITMQFTTPLSPCIVKPSGNKDANYLVLPLKLKS